MESELIPMIRDVTPAADGYLAVGDAWDASAGMFGPGAWKSPDGRSWQGVDINLELGPGPYPGVFTQVEAIGDRYVGAMAGQLFVSDASARSWRYVALGEGACPTQLARKDGRVVAVGGIGACRSDGPSRPAAWFSSDGLSWSPATLDGTDVVGGQFKGVLAIPGGFLGWGFFSAHETTGYIGSTPVPGEPYAGAPWFSADGTSWARLLEPGPFTDARIEGIVRGDGVLVALGTIGDFENTVQGLWTSAYGGAWARVTTGLPFGDSSGEIPGPQSMSLAIGGGPPGIVLWSLAGDAGMQLWVSHDGLNWSVADALAPYAYLRGVFEVGGGLLAVGTRDVADPGVPLPCTKTDVLSGACRVVGTLWTSGL